MEKRSIRDIDVKGRLVLVRVDFNVPLHKETRAITDDTRIRASLPTIRYLLDKGAAVILCSHLGRPDGKVVESLRLAPVAARLEELLGRKVEYLRDCVGDEVAAMKKQCGPGQVLLLENLRFHPEEEANDPTFAQELAASADVFVNDAFGTAHRAHASTAGVAAYLPAVAGFLMEQEVSIMGRALSNPLRPFVAIIGGAKVSGKIAVLENLLTKVDSLIIGGGMACTFLKAKGLEMGQSLVEADRLELAEQLFKRAEERGVRLLLPNDVVIGREFQADTATRIVAADSVLPDWRVMDIGPATVEAFGTELRGARTVLWNGPMGVFEFPAFANGTHSIARVLSEIPATTIVGGGETAEAVQEMGLADKITHVSTGGGATLEFLEGKTLPGVAALLDK